MKKKFINRLLNFIMIEVLLIIIVIFLSKGNYYTLTYIILLITPFILILSAGILEIYYQRKYPHLLLISVVVFTIISFNSYLIIDDNTIWNGLFIPPSVIINDEGVTNLIYITSLVQLLIITILYVIVINFTKKNR